LSWHYNDIILNEWWKLKRINLLWIVWRRGWAWITCGCTVWIICGPGEEICRYCPGCVWGFWIICNGCGCCITCNCWGCWKICCGCCWTICNGWGWGWGCWIIKLVARWSDVCGTLTKDWVFVFADNELKTGIWLIIVGWIVDCVLSRQTNCCCCCWGEIDCWIILLLFDVQR